MWLPDWLYESLPFLYAITAALCLFTLEASFGSAISTAALSAAALTTWNMRYRARSAALRQKHRRSSKLSSR